MASPRLRSEVCCNTTAYTNPANACGSALLSAGIPTFLDNEGVAVRCNCSNGFGAWPGRVSETSWPSRDLRLHTHTLIHAWGTEAMLHSPQQLKPLSPCHTRMLSKQFVRISLEECSRLAGWTAKQTNPHVWKSNIMDFKTALGKIQYSNESIIPLSTPKFSYILAHA